MTTNLTSTSVGAFEKHVAILSGLVRCDAGAFERLLSLGDTKAQAFTHFAVHNQLSCYLFARLSDEGLLGQCPTRLAKRISAQRSRQENVTRRASSELARVSDQLSRFDCPFMLLKGMNWSEKFYGGPNRRNSWDIDILVPPLDVRRAERVIMDAGYRRKSPVLLSAKLTRQFTHAFDFTNGNVTIDLHWCLSNHPAFRIDYDLVWRERNEFQLGEASYNVLPDQYELVFALISILRDIERGALRMKAFVDLYAILGVLHAETDWDVFFRARQQERLATICANVLWCFLEVFDCGSDFPALSSTIEGRQDVVHVQGQGQAQAFELLRPSRFGLVNKRWASGLYDTSVAAYYAWWGVSLPFRMLVHKRKKRRRGNRKATRRPT